MTIPISPVDIKPQYAPPYGPTGVELLLTAVHHRQELNAAQARLAQEQQQFEVHKRLLGAQTEGTELENLKRKQDLKNATDDLAARDQALQIFTGNLPRLGDSKGVGEVIAGIKDPRVAAHFYDYLKDHLSNMATMASTRATTATATATESANAGADQAQQILQDAGPDLATPQGQSRAILKIAQAVGPDEANKAATAFNTGSNRYHPLAGPDGFVYIVDSKTGGVRQDRTIGVTGQNMRADAIKRNAGTLVDLLDEQSKLITDLGIGSSRNPTAAGLLEGGRVLGLSTEALSNSLRDDPEAITRMLRTRFAHNYVGMLPNSRSAGQLLQNLAESYWAPAGSSDAVLARAETDRQKLRGILAGVRDGKITDMTRIPGFSAAMAGAASEGSQVSPQAGGPTGPTYRPENPY